MPSPEPSTGDGKGGFTILTIPVLVVGTVFGITNWEFWLPILMPAWVGGAVEVALKVEGEDAGTGVPRIGAGILIPPAETP